MAMKNRSKETISVHEGTFMDPLTKGVVSPIFPSSSFSYIDVEENQYPRYFNTPNQKAVADKLAKLEQGEACMLFSSGMAAITTVLFSYLKTGDHAIFQNDLYGGTQNAIKNELEKFGIEYSMVNSTDVEDFAKQVRSNTKVIYIETPSNPLLNVVDIRSIADLAKANNLVSVIDNTFASPINQNPISLGLDVVIHSATKYLGGHSDLLCGAAISSEQHIANIHASGISYGGSLNAMTCYLLERSLKTLAIRVEKQNSNAGKIAEYLESHGGVNAVNYPGLASHANHEIAARQMEGFGGMLSFDIDTDLEGCKVFSGALKLIIPAMSLGGVETIVSSPPQTSHAKISKEEREALGISDTLLRLSVGIEHVDDIIEDLDQALSKVKNTISA